MCPWRGGGTNTTVCFRVLHCSISLSIDPIKLEDGSYQLALISVSWSSGSWFYVEVWKSIVIITPWGVNIHFGSWVMTESNMLWFTLLNKTSLWLKRTEISCFHLPTTSIRLCCFSIIAVLLNLCYILTDALTIHFESGLFLVFFNCHPTMTNIRLCCLSCDKRAFEFGLFLTKSVIK